MTSEVFFAAKGATALVGTVLLLAHMMTAWDHMELLGQRLRYVTLLWFAMTITGASVRQVHDSPPVRVENVATLLGCGLLVITMIVSIVELRNSSRVA